MKKYEKILKQLSNLLIFLLYYIFIIGFLLFNPYSNVIISYSNMLGVIFLLSSVVLIFLPTILKRKMHMDKLTVIIYSFLAIIIFLTLTLIIGSFTKKYFETFSYEKWNNSNYCSMRYMMVESLENQHSFIGMNREDIYNTLGRIDKKSCAADYEEDNKICYMTYEIEKISRDYYCIYLDENDIVISTKYQKGS